MICKAVCVPYSTPPRLQEAALTIYQSCNLSSHQLYLHTTTSGHSCLIPCHRWASGLRNVSLEKKKMKKKKAMLKIAMHLWSRLNPNAPCRGPISDCGMYVRINLKRDKCTNIKHRQKRKESSFRFKIALWEEKNTCPPPLLTASRDSLM